MDREEQYRTWLSNNQDKQGTPEFQTVQNALNMLALSPEQEQAIMSESQPERTFDSVVDEGKAQWDRYNESSFLDKLAGSSGGRFIRGAINLPAGAFQFGAMVGDAVGPGGSGIPQGVADALNSWDASIERGSIDDGVDWARLGGEGAAGAGIGRALPVGRNLLARALLGFGEGAGFGAITPAVSENIPVEKGLQIGGGAVLGTAVPLLSKAGSFIRERFTEAGRRNAAGRMANEAAGDNRDEIVRLLRENRNPLGQGSAGEVASPAGSAEFSGLQRIARNRQPTEYAALEAAQRNARNRAINQVAGGDEGLSLAQAIRSARGNQDYQRAFEQPFQQSAAFAQLLDDPFVRSAINKVDDVAQSQNVPKGSTEYYHMVKRVLDDMVAPPSAQRPSSLSDLERQAAGNVRQRFISEMEKINPSYGIARTRFAQNSKPINQMQVGRELSDALNQPVTDSLDTGAQQSAARFASALRAAPRTIKRATGESRYSALSDVLTPKQITNVEAVADDLARASRDSNLASKGLNRAADIVGVLNSASLPNALVRPIMVINAILKRTGSKSADLTLGELSSLMRNPKRLADVMDAARPDEKETIMRMFQTALIQQSGEATGTGVNTTTNLFEDIANGP